MKTLLAILFIVMAMIPSVAVAESYDNYTPKQLKEMASTDYGPSMKSVQGIPISPTAVGAPDSVTACWTTNLGMYQDYGIWPQEQRVYEDRDWCTNYLGGPQTYRTTHVYLSGTWCSHSGAYGTRVSGGNGYTWTTVRSGGHFNCPSGFWWDYNFDNYVEFACNTWGNCSYVRHGRL